MADTSPFGKFVPGFDFLQGLVSNAGAALPGIGQWVAPTLNPEDLEKRIDELRTVQFWLEQNARMLGATVQALEVQRMTLSTLKTMNVQMEDLRDSLQIKTPQSTDTIANFFTPAKAPAATSAAPAPVPAVPPAPQAPPAATTATPPPGVDPMQWWGALTQQFTQLATQAMQQSAAEVGKHMAPNAPPKATGGQTATGRAASSKAAPVGAKSPAIKNPAIKPGAKSTPKPGAKATPRSRPAKD